MIIKQTQFIKSATRPAEYPESLHPEIAFAGRSNVGKSSLINCLVGRKQLVKTSSRPGCTQLINFFSVNDDLCFVDLPGYGYAKVAKTVRARWQPMIETYLQQRATLIGLILLLDIRRDPGKEEMVLAGWLAERELPYLVVLTKADKLSRARQDKARQRICDQINRRADEVILFSSKTRLGRDRVLDEIDNLVEWYHER